MEDDALEPVGQSDDFVAHPEALQPRPVLENCSSPATLLAVREVAEVLHAGPRVFVPALAVLGVFDVLAFVVVVPAGRQIAAEPMGLAALELTHIGVTVWKEVHAQALAFAVDVVADVLVVVGVGANTEAMRSYLIELSDIFITRGLHQHSKNDVSIPVDLALKQVAILEVDACPPCVVAVNASFAHVAVSTQQHPHLDFDIAVFQRVEHEMQVSCPTQLGRFLGAFGILFLLFFCFKGGHFWSLF